uniref:Uncharacterized protein n=1 Tax=Plectus sambesii TaxID=2011161 RepID=A0A914XCJ6_9BILA
MASSQSSQQASFSSAQEIAPENSCKDKRDYNNTYNTYIQGGRVVSGSVSGGIVVQGDYFAPSQPLPAPPPPTPEELRIILENVQSSLRRIYSKSYRSVIQFSAPFFFDVED